jgi:hypothetical protein
MLLPTIPVTLRNGKFYAVWPDNQELEGAGELLRLASAPFAPWWDGLDNGLVVNTTSEELRPLLGQMQLLTPEETEVLAQEFSLIRRTNSWNFIRAMMPQLDDVIRLAVSVYDIHMEAEAIGDWDNLIGGISTHRTLLAAKELATGKQPEELDADDEMILFSARKTVERISDLREG